jgi:Protein kinase domain
MVRTLMTGAPGRGALKDPLIGQVIQGRYRIHRTIGTGGMGVVYEAQHLLIGRKVAVKVLTARGLLSNASVVRFRREAQAAASVGNSHVVDVLDMGQLDDGTLYIVLEHLEGAHLGWAVAQSGPFSAARAVHVMCQLCDALSAVHAADIVHRDLKPENIFLIERDGEPDFVKVLDFGVCRFNDRDGASLTASGDMVGTPLFMAPEQVENQCDIDHRTDVYALGAILHFLLTGRAPFDAPTLPKLFIQICVEPAPSVRAVDASVPAELDAIVSRALSKSPELRFESCAAFKQALLHFHEASPSSRARRKEELAATLPVDTSSSYTGDAEPASAAAAVEVAKGRRRRVRRLGIAALASLAGLAAALLSVAVLAPPAPSAAPVVSAPTPKAAQPGADEPANHVSVALLELPLDTAKSAAPNPQRLPQSRREPSAAADDEPAEQVATTSASDEQPEVDGSSLEPASAPTPPAPAVASPLDIRLNKGPKRDL